MKQCVIFDMDGTLLDSSRGMTASVNYVRDQLGLPPIDVAMLTYYINTPGENLPLRFYGTQEYDPHHRAIFKEHYMEHCAKELRLYEGIVDVLEWLSSKVMMAVATNASDFFAQKMLESTNIDHYFQLVVGANTLGVSKPDPAMIEHVIREMGSHALHTVLIGDSEKDELAALHAKTKFIYASWGYGEYKAPSSIVCAKPEELKRVLEKELIL